MERFLITGMNGAIAPYVARFADEMGGSVTASTRNGKLHREISKKLPCVACDITDFESVKKTIRKTKPEVVVNFAAVSTLLQGWQDPVLTFKTNTIGTANFLESLRQLRMDTRFIAVGSREEYGVKKNLPINENESLGPINPYGVAKAAADMLAMQYFKKYNVQTICTRLFNQTAPIWPERFVDSNWCKQIARIEAGLAKPQIMVGELDNVRDFTDCRDVARAFWLLAQKGKAGNAYNICSQKPTRMSDMLKGLLLKSTANVKIKTDPSRIFADQIKEVWGDNSKLRRHTGWKPEISLETTHTELLTHWRGACRA